MDSIVSKLSDIEVTAEAIVAHAESQKPVIEREVQAKRDAFDKELEENTQSKLLAIRNDLTEKTEKILDEQRRENSSSIENLKKDFEANHTRYARELLTRIIEV